MSIRNFVAVGLVLLLPGVVLAQVMQRQPWRPGGMNAAQPNNDMRQPGGNPRQTAAKGPQAGSTVDEEGVVDTANLRGIQMLNKSNQRITVSIPTSCKVHVTGTSKAELLKTGMVVQFTAEIDKKLTAQDKVTQLTITSNKPMGLFPPGGGEKPDIPADKPTGRSGKPSDQGVGGGGMGGGGMGGGGMGGMGGGGMGMGGRMGGRNMRGGMGGGMGGSGMGGGGMARGGMARGGMGGGGMGGGGMGGGGMGGMSGGMGSSAGSTTHKASTAMQLPATCLVRGTLRKVSGSDITVSAGGRAIKAQLSDTVEISVDMADCSGVGKNDTISVKGRSLGGKQHSIQAQEITVEMKEPYAGPKKGAAVKHPAKPAAPKAARPKSPVEDADAAQPDEQPKAEPAEKPKVGEPAF